MTRPFSFPTSGPTSIAVGIRIPALKQSTDVQTGSETNPIQIKSIEVSPDPPKPGQDLTVTVSGTAVETIEVHLPAYLTRLN